MEKPILISGIQPTGRLHIGNYLGALKSFTELQDSGKYECYMFVADLHSITENYDVDKKREQIFELTSDFISAGINPKKTTIFLQSMVPAHSELAWILSSITPVGELRRMTQFKDKAKNQKNNVNAGLFVYPTLMAADILLYNAEFVPVGEDQLQHLELTRTIARKFNNRFGETFVEPKPVLTKAIRVKNLLNPAKKMSKSNPLGCLFIDDKPSEIKNKIKRAVTDSGSEIKFDRAKKPGISNLLTIYSELSGKTTKEIEKEFRGKTYSELKTKLANLISDYFKNFRRGKSKLMKNKIMLKRILASGSAKAEKIANKKIKEVKKKIGVLI